MNGTVPPPHPADFLNDVLIPATGRSDGEIAHLLGISPQAYYKLLTREKPITRATAEMLGRLFQTGVDFWLDMQAEFARHTASCLTVEREIPQLAAPGSRNSHCLTIELEAMLERVPPDERICSSV